MLTQEEGARLLAAALLDREPVFELRVELVDDAVMIHTGIDRWRVEPLEAGHSPAYEVFLARPAVPGSGRIRALAQLPDGRTFTLDDADGVSAFNASGVVDPLVVGRLAARFADAEDYPRRILTAGDLAPTVLAVTGPDGGSSGAVVTVHTARVDHTEDEEPFDRIERWRILVTPAAVRWSIERGGDTA